MKKYLMLRGLFILGIVISANAFAFGKGAFDRVPTHTGNYCKDEAITWIENKIGAETKIIKVDKVGPSGGDWYYYAQIEACNGNFYFQYSVNDHINCTVAQYGTPIKYLKRVWAEGDCKRLLDSDDYPHL